jgi:hypothetical protein
VCVDTVSQASLSANMLRNMLDGDGQDQYDAGGWCFPKPIPPVQRNGEWIVMEPLGQVKCNEAFEQNLREYPGEKVPKKKKEWQSVQGGSILTICKLHPSQRPPMVRPEDDNEVHAPHTAVYLGRTPFLYLPPSLSRAHSAAGCGGTDAPLDSAAAAHRATRPPTPIPESTTFPADPTPASPFFAGRVAVGGAGRGAVHQEPRGEWAAGGEGGRSRQGQPLER